MSTRRRRRSLPMSQLRRGPNGRRLCRWCDREVPKGKVTFCGPDCVHEHRLRSDPGYLREQVYIRDRGICAGCGLDAVAEYHRLMLLQRVDPKAFEKEVRSRRIPRAIYGGNEGALWQAHHKRAVREGGGECDLANMATLCVWCHRKAHASGRRRAR